MTFLYSTLSGPEYVPAQVALNSEHAQEAFDLDPNRRLPSRNRVGRAGRARGVGKILRRTTAKAIDLARCQLARMCDLASSDRTDGRSFDRRYGGGVPVECCELHLEGFAVGVDMNNRPDIACLKALIGQRCCQNDPVVFRDHAENSLLAGTSGHQTRCFGASIDDPDRPHRPTLALLSLRRYRAIDNMFLTVGRLDTLHNLAGLSHRAKSANQRLRVLDRETERFKELSLPPLSGCAEFIR